MTSLRLALLLLSGLSFSLIAGNDPHQQLHDSIEDTLKRFEVPGAGVAVVRNGEIVFERGYGVRKWGAPEKVDQHTLFGIASNTKAITAASLAILVDDGLIQWTDPVIAHLPEFRMYDPYVSAEITVEDLLTHRSGLGLGAGDLLHWPLTQYTKEEIVYRLRYIKPSSSFRSKYAYDNVLYLVAGEVVEAVSGKPWTEFVKERILGPLGMERANFTAEDFVRDPNHVQPHAVLEGTLQSVEIMGLDNVAPAGAINASVHEMTHWLKVQLAEGKYEGGQLFSQKQAGLMHRIVTPLDTFKMSGELAALNAHFRGYGLGWYVQDYRGKKMVYHTGGLLGQVSRVTLLPNEQLGIVVLTNQQSGNAFNAITYNLLDHFLGAEGPNWTDVFEERANKYKEQLAKKAEEKEASRAKDVGPSLPMEKYAGTYEDSWYGSMSIAREGEQWIMRFGKTPLLTGTVEHYQYDTFLVRWHDRSLEADALATFSLTAEGGIERLKMKPLSPATDFSFNFQDLEFHPAAEK